MEGYFADSLVSAVSSSFVVPCSENHSLFNFQACQPVQCNPMPPMKCISPMIQVGYLFQQNLVLQCVDDYSDDEQRVMTLHCSPILYDSFSSPTNGVASPTCAETVGTEIDLAGSQGLEGMKVEMTKNLQKHCLPESGKIARSCDEFSERLQIFLFTLGDPLNAVHNATADV